MVIILLRAALWQRTLGRRSNKRRSTTKAGQLRRTQHGQGHGRFTRRRLVKGGGLLPATERIPSNLHHRPAACPTGVPSCARYQGDPVELGWKRTERLSEVVVNVPKTFHPDARATLPRWCPSTRYHRGEQLRCRHEGRPYPWSQGPPEFDRQRERARSFRKNG